MYPFSNLLFLSKLLIVSYINIFFTVCYEEEIMHKYSYLIWYQVYYFEKFPKLYQQIIFFNKSSYMKDLLSIFV